MLAKGIKVIKLLAKIFIKNNGNYKDSTVREKYGILCSSVGIVLNIFLFAGKFVTGFFSKSLAITADSFNNLSDAGSSLISMIGFKLAGKKADSLHPFGHGRMEYITGLIVSFLIIVMGIELAEESVKNIINPKPIEFSMIFFIVLGISILIKLYMAFYNKIIGKKIASTSMKAASLDSFSDSIATAVVFISIVISKYTDFNIDGYAGLSVSLFIIWSGICATKETIAPLLGQAADKQFVMEIEKIVLSHSEILGLHDLIVHDYGPGRLMLSLHAEVDGQKNTFEIHDVIDRIEYEINNKFNCEAVIHTDPIELNNAKLAEIKSLIDSILEKLNPELKFHDLRIVRGDSQINILFDVVLIPSLYDQEKILEEKICSEVLKTYPNYYCIIKFDKKYS